MEVSHKALKNIPTKNGNESGTQCNRGYPIDYVDGIRTRTPFELIENLAMNVVLRTTLVERYIKRIFHINRRSSPYIQGWYQ